MSEHRSQAIAELADEYTFIKTVERGDEEIDEEVIEFTSQEAKEAFKAGWELRRLESRAIERPVLTELLETWQNENLPTQGSYWEAAEDLEELLEAQSETS